MMCLWRAEAVGKTAWQRRPRVCCHLQTHVASPAGVLVCVGGSRIELVSIEGVVVGEFMGFIISCWIAEARKSSLLAPMPWGKLSKEESGSIQSLLLLLKPIIELSNWLLNILPFDMPPMVTGEVGWLWRPKFTKPFESPLPCAIEAFHKSRLC